jgi:cobalt-zinc-cadmium efflux system membrane fusion protein
MSAKLALRVSARGLARAIRLVAPLALAAFGAGCHSSEAAVIQQAPPAPPQGEVWLTQQQVKDAKIEVSPLTPRNVDDTILTSGTIALDDQRTGHVFSPVTGRVVSIIGGLGERVAKGAPLAVIESPDIGNAVSDVHKAEADLLTAEHDLKRKKTLYEQKAGSPADVEAANDTYRRAKAEVERARQKEVLLRVGNADTVTQRYTLPSPVDGEILLRNINPGIEVQGQYSGGATQELFTIGELDRVWILGDLYEMDFARVHVGSPAKVSVVAYSGEVFKGTVDWVASALDPGTRTAKVRCTFDNPGKRLRPMMYATVQISVDQETALAIPRNALLRLGDQRVVFVEVAEEAGIVHFRRAVVDVDEGESSPWLVVRKGLEAGQKVVTNGVILLSQGS